jgi:uncharacterized protein YjeT (DUF2065 family)
VLWAGAWKQLWEAALVDPRKAVRRAGGLLLLLLLLLLPLRSSEIL